MQLSLFEGPTSLEPAFQHPNLSLGTASWNYPGWAGLVFERPNLAAYAAHPLFGCVGLESTFYSPLSEAQYAVHAAEVSADFSFLVKAPRTLVDPGSEFYADPTWARRCFLEPARRGLGQKLAMAHFVFPPAGHRGDWSRFFAELADFPLSYEVRQPMQWSAPGLVRAWNIFPGLDWPQPQTGAWRVVRWTLRPVAPEVPWDLRRAALRYLPFSGLRDPDAPTRRRVAAQVLSWLREGLKVWVVVNNKAEGCAPLSLRLLTEELGSLSASP